MANRFGDQEVSRFGDVSGAPSTPPAEKPGFGSRAYDASIGGIVQSIRHPIDTFVNTLQTAVGVDQWKEIGHQISQGNYGQAALLIGRHAQQGPAGRLMEPVADVFNKDLAEGNLQGAAGTVFGVSAMMAAPELLPKAAGALKTVAKNSAIGRLVTNPGVVRAGMEVLPKGEKMLSLYDKIKAAAEPPGPGEPLARAQGIDYASLKPEEQAMLDNAARAQANVAAQRSLRPTSLRPLPAGPSSRVVIPPSRQLAAPVEPIVTQAPPDTSFVRGVPAQYPDVIPPGILRAKPQAAEAALALREAMGLGTEQFRPPAEATAPGLQEATRAGQIDRMAQKLRAAGVGSKDAARMDQSTLAALTQAAGEEPLGVTPKDMVSRLNVIEQQAAETARYQQAYDAAKGQNGRAPEPAAPPTAEALPATAEEANAELGKLYPKPAAIEERTTAPPERIEQIAQHIAADRGVTPAMLDRIAKRPGAQLDIEKMGFGRPANIAEYKTIVDRVREIRGEETQAAPPVVPKEPWQMTRREWLDTYPERTRAAVRTEVERKIGDFQKQVEMNREMLRSDPNNPANGAIREGIATTEKQIAEQVARLTAPIKSPEETWTPAQIKWHHVEGALREGKPVPPEVLADYPDLQPKPAIPESPKPEAAPAQKTSWLDTLTEGQKESVFVVMRKVRADADRMLEEHRRLSPSYGQIAVGGAHIDPMLKAYAREDMLRTLSKGGTVDEAIAAGKAAANQTAQKFNATRKRDWQVQRPGGMADTELEHIGRLLREAATRETPKPEAKR